MGNGLKERFPILSMVIYKSPWKMMRLPYMSRFRRTCSLSTSKREPGFSSARKQISYKKKFRRSKGKRKLTVAFLGACDKFIVRFELPVAFNSRSLLTPKNVFATLLPCASSSWKQFINYQIQVTLGRLEKLPFRALAYRWSKLLIFCSQFIVFLAFRHTIIPPSVCFIMK